MLSVVIPAYNEENYIGQCLESLTKQDTKEPFEVIVVDNASTDRTAEVAKSCAGKLNLRVIREEKKGRGAARAAGFRVAHGEIIFSTDADCMPPPEWLATFCAELKRHPEAVAVTSPLTVQDCSSLKNRILNLQSFLIYLSRALTGHFWLYGYSFAITREAYVSAGGFDPEADAMEDVDLSFRVRKVGKIRFFRSLRMPVSGRRFQEHGLLKGTWPYFHTFGKKFLFRKRRAELSDVR